MTLWKAMLYKLTDLEMLHIVLQKQQVGTQIFNLSVMWFIFIQEDRESVVYMNKEYQLCFMLLLGA
jgi:hypothetical protein